jgi:hypothetical protein
VLGVAVSSDQLECSTLIQRAPSKRWRVTRKPIRCVIRQEIEATGMPVPDIQVLPIHYLEQAPH